MTKGDVARAILCALRGDLMASLANSSESWQLHLTHASHQKVLSFVMIARPMALGPSAAEEGPPHEGNYVN